MRESKYSISIAVLYLFVSTYFFFFIPSSLSYYDFRESDLAIFFLIAACAFASLFIVNHFLHFGKVIIPKKSLPQVLVIAFYALVLIALPEEIIFRGFIQHSLQSVIPDAGVVLVLSSVIFGMAHIPNGARGLLPKKWNWRLAVMASVAGLYLGAAYLITSSLLIPTILHALMTVAARIFIIKE